MSIRFAVSLLVLTLASASTARIAVADGGVAPSAPPNYALAADWVCRPGSEHICTADLDAKVIDANGAAHVASFVAASDPPIDCFYVYPTVSLEPTPYSDLAIAPEVARAVNAQAGRLSSRCRVFAPAYRQATIAQLRAAIGGNAPAQSDAPADDIAAAWAYYLTHDNHGRGVVLVGHSQGTILLQQLIASKIDGTPAQALLVAAFLAGDPSLGVPPGARAGGTFAHVPLCSSLEETGCVYVWGSYLDRDASTDRFFGSVRGDGLVSACVDPAAPSGGTGSLLTFARKAFDAPASDPPWVERVGQFSATCRADANGDVLRVSVVPGPLAADDETLLDEGALRAGWGLHRLDIGLLQGNVLDAIAAETRSWLARHPR